MSMIGTRVVRREDPALLSDGGTYVADTGPEDAAHLIFVRSTMAHAALLEVDTVEAESAPGVLAVFTADSLGMDARAPGNPMIDQAFVRAPLASGTVRFVGEPIVAIVAQSIEQGVDAAELVVVDYEPLDVVVDVDDAADGDVLLFPEIGTNRCFSLPPNDSPDPTEGCDVVVELVFDNPRLTAAPIEPRAAVAEWRDGRLTQWSSTQFPHRTRDALASAVGVETESVRVITPDVGGGFGAKNGSYVEDLVLAQAAKRLDRPIRWTETRTESMLSLAHARSLRYRLAMGGTADGDIQALRIHMIQDAGAYPLIGAILPFLSLIMASGCYAIPAVKMTAESMVTNTVPIGAYRGAGRPEATLPLERIIDVFAAEIGMDAGELRRKNFHRPADFPVKTPTGADMDSGAYAEAMDRVATAAGHDELRAEQARRIDDPSVPLLGLGWCAYVEIANPMGAGEYGSMRVRPDGSAVVLTGSSAHGQGHDTAFAQIASDQTGIAFDRIEVRHGDTDEVPRGGGTGGSRSLQTGGVAVWNAAGGLVDRAKAVAADVLEASVDDIVLDLEAGAFSVAGTPAVTVSWGDVAARWEGDEQTPFIEETDFQPPAATFPFGVHLSVVEVDRDTGQVTPLRHIACDDAGVIVNPTIVDGQVHGGVSAGMSQALMEVFTYDEDGNPLTANFMDYAMPAASEFPSFERLVMETPTDRNPMGVKGIGESGTIGATPAVQNAVVDALSHLGVTHVDIPVSPQRVWQAINRG